MVATKKKKIFYHSDFALLKTGFGRVARSILSYLYKTDKYEIVQFCCGLTDNNPAFERVPWKCIGALRDDPSEIQNLQRDPRLAQLSSYGAYRIDDAIRNEKPDVYFAVQDIWGVDYTINKKWFSKDNSVIWTTLDSLPILSTAIEASKKVKHFWVWSDFATKALHKLGHKHVETVHGPLDGDRFYRLKDDDRAGLRKKFNIEPSDFVVGFVFRNQLRKSIPNLLEGYKLFKIKNKDLIKGKTYLLLHTNFIEGWNIHKLADEIGVDKKEILTTYCCKACNVYSVSNYIGNEVQCPNCKTEKSMGTTNIQFGVFENQLNEVYNIMDVYCHPFTSGGQEIPIQEAKLTELITLVTNYSCGEEMCQPEAHSLALDWSEYREHNTEFIKASTYAKSISDQLTRVYKMSPKDRQEKGRKARQWVLKNFDIKVIGKKFEEFIDSRQEINDNKIYEVTQSHNPEAKIDDSLPDKDWIISLYKKILDMDVDDIDKGYTYWKNEIDKGILRKDIEEYFRGIARKEIVQKQNLNDFLDVDDKGKRILYVIPESAGDVYMATSLFSNLKRQYPNYNLYVSTLPQYMEIVKGHPSVHKVIPYFSQMDDIHFLEGGKDNEGYFEIAFLSHVNAQRHSCYTHNGLDKIAFDIKG